MHSDSLHFLPRPRDVRFGHGIVDLDLAGTVVIPDGLDARFSRAVARWTEALARETGRRPRVAAGISDRQAPWLRLILTGGDLPSQGYRLQIASDGAILEAPDAIGLFQGLQTLLQLLRQTGPRVPELTIGDHPDFPNRGYMIDVSRCKVPRMATLYALVDRLAEWKINQLQLYIEHTFAFSGHEVVWGEASPFTAEEILALDAYCHDRYIELVPNLNSFGHLERWLRHPEYYPLAESPGGFIDPWNKKRPFGSTLKPNDASLAFLDALYREYLPNFSSRNVNIGCDETWELGQGWSRPLVEEKGTARVYLDFLLKIHRLAESHGRRVQFWGDIVLKQPELVRELPRSITGMIWGYEADHPYEDNCRAFQEAGIPFYVVPGTSSWKTLTGRTDNALAAIQSAAINGLRFGAQGLLVTEWGDAGHHQFPAIGLPGIAWAAAVAWCVDSNRDLPLAAALDIHRFGSPDAGLAVPLLDLGRVHRLTGKTFPQSTLFHQLLFTPGPDLGETLEGVSPEALRTCLEKLDEIESALKAAYPRCGDGPLLLREIALNLRMARHGIRRGLAHLSSGTPEWRPLHRDLREITGTFEALWLARARPGGLHESSGYLRAITAEYRDALIAEDPPEEPGL